MRDVRLVIRHTVQLHRLDIAILTAHSVGPHRERLSVSQMQLHFRVQRSAQLIPPAHRIYGIKAHRAEHVPRRHLPAILIAAQPGGRIEVKLVHHPRGILLRLPRLPHGIEQVNNVMTRLIAVRILPDHARAKDGQFVVFARMVSEHAVQLLRETLLASCQFYQALHVVLHRPEVLPAVAFANVRRVVIRAERLHEVSPAVPWLHEARLGIIDITIVLRPPVEFLGNVCPSHLLGHAGNAMVIVGILQRLGQ